jgi:16S rRNA (adenine1518-N6/adenine1519-N6)-dimethyltransferase
VVRLRFHPPDPAVTDRSRFSEVVKRVFTKRRKTLENALGKEARPALAAVGIDGRRRPETLSIAEFARLADALG